MTEDDFYAEMALGEAEYRGMDDTADTALCPACWGLTNGGLLCESCERAADSVSVR